MNYAQIERVLGLVHAERCRQERLKADGRFEFTCADDGMTDFEKLACLVEEVGEVAQEALAQPHNALVHDTVGSVAKLREELVQVAAVAVAWVEATLA